MILQLPKHFNLVVGDTFELFYRGILYCVDPSFYDIEFTFDDGGNYGNAYRKKFVYTPTESDVGTRALTVTLRDNVGAILEKQKVELRIFPKPVSPKEERVILCVGDSLTEPGVWVEEFKRRLTESGGTPAGDGLKNLRFIGNIERNGARFEGYGGWAFSSYSASYASPRFYYIYGDFSDKSERGDQHSFYKDENDVVWKIESIKPTRIKLIRVTWCEPTPPVGVLRHESGGTNHGDIVFTSCDYAEANPFFDSETRRNDFHAYVKRMGVDKIDEVIILLGGNSTHMKEYEYKHTVRTFLDSLFAEFPDCRVLISGMIIPDRDGLGHNYGTSWKWFEKVGFLFSLGKWYEDIANENAYLGKIDTMCLSAQFDTEHNFPKTEMPVNCRSSLIEPIGTNALHCTSEGYLQMADAFYRAIVPHFQD